MRRQLVPALRAVVLFTLVLGLAYPLVVTAVAQAGMKGKANGSLVERDGRLIGSSLIGQSFTSPEYFWPRPSNAGDGYDGSASGASNLGPSNPKLIAQCNDDGNGGCDPDSVPQRAEAYREANGLDAGTPVPVDAVTSSGSGLDPHISVANARLQAQRVAKARGLEVEKVRSLIDAHTDGRVLGVLGEPGVNVLELNLALDQG